MSKKGLKRAFDDGALAQRGGCPLARALLIFDTREEKAAAGAGWIAQKENIGRTVKFTLPFDIDHWEGVVEQKLNQPRSTKGTDMATRTKEELDKLRDEYFNDLYKPYADAEKAAGREPQDFDEAFNAHLAELDKEAAEQTAADIDGTETPAPAPANKGKGKGKGGTKKPAKPKTERKPRPKAFRPTSDDRKALNAAAADAATKAKAEGTPRMKPQKGDPGDTYSDFLTGKTLKLDENGNGDCSLDVVTAKDMDTVIGRVDVTVRKGEMKAKGVKAT